MELIYAIDVYNGEEYLGTDEYYAEYLAEEAIEELLSEGLDYEVFLYQYYVPDYHYDRFSKRG